MTEQITNRIMMIRPAAFRMNEQTVVNNYYQRPEATIIPGRPQQEAIDQFDAFVKMLRAEGVTVTVFDDTLSPSTPDSLFPNNWVSFHQDGKIRLYPMFAANRRQERREDILSGIQNMFKVEEVVSFTKWEEEGAFLEGTGSLLLDRQNKMVYAAMSERTMRKPLNDFCREAGFQPVTFHANQTVNGKRLPIYHTNVMMCLGEAFAVVCPGSIDDEADRKALIEALQQTNKEFIEITEKQKEQFAGNMLQVIGKDQARLIVMSTAAYRSLDEMQVKRLSFHGKIVHSDLRIIEKLGGGSARCMMAEVFLPEQVGQNTDKVC